MATTQHIAAGERIEALDVAGKQLRRRAVSGVVPGHDFPVVWVTSEEEWQAALDEGRDPDAVPWPAEDVRPLTDDAGDEDENEAGFRIVQDATQEGKD
jgi:hypothetical protein